MDLLCPRCGDKVPSSSVDIHRVSAKCSACDIEFPFEGPVRSVERGNVVTRPASIIFDEGELPARGAPAYSAITPASARGTRRITMRRASTSDTTFGLFFLSVWLMYGLCWSRWFSALPWSIRAVHWAVYAWMGYEALASLVRRTTIVVDARRVTIRSGPLPGFRTRTVVDVDRVRRLFVRGHSWRRKGSIVTTYALAAEVDGVATDLVSGLSIEEARFLEQRLGEHLSITDDLRAR